MMTAIESALQEAYDRYVEREREKKEEESFRDSCISENEDELLEEDDPDYEGMMKDAADEAAYQWYVQNARG